MVVLAAAVTTKAGKVLLSRQYRDMSRIRIEGLLAAFPKLVGTEKQHTYVETDAVRYVYQPVESLYMLLITTKGSNIVEDLETLRLMGKILPEYSPQYGVVDEESVIEAAFEIIHSFDEVIDWGGFRENVNLQQIATFTEMYSHEDRLAKMIKESKMQEAKDEAKRKAQSIRKQGGGGDQFGALGNEIGKIMESSGLGGLAADLGLMKKAAPPIVPGAQGAYGGISSAQYAAMHAQGDSNIPLPAGVPSKTRGISSAQYASSQDTTPAFGTGYSQDGNFGASSAGPTPMSFDRPSNTPTVAGKVAGKGMSLGAKGKKQDSLLDAMRAEGEVVDAPLARKKGPQSQQAAAFVPTTEAIHLSSIEKIAVTINRDGGIEKMEVKGDLMLRISDPEKAAIRVAVKMGDVSMFQVRTHPNIDKNLFTSQGLLGLKETNRPFPTGNPLGILRWRMESKDEKMIPLLINCWPSESGKESQVNIEYELVRAQELRDVVISIPCHSGGHAPSVSQCDGEFAYNQRAQCVEWRIPMIDSSNPQGTLEFATAAMDPDSFFPVSVSFISKQPYAQIQTASVTVAQTGEPVKYSQEVSLVPEEYKII